MDAVPSVALPGAAQHAGRRRERPVSSGTPRSGRLWATFTVSAALLVLLTCVTASAVTRTCGGRVRPGGQRAPTGSGHAARGAARVLCCEPVGAEIVKWLL